MNLWRLLAKLVLPYVRLELPGWGRLLRLVRADGTGQAFWEDAPAVLVRGKDHGYLMRLDLADPWDRGTYFLARFEELDAVLFAREAIRPGDSVVDVGANRGAFTLLASRRVGPSGSVYALEPNPAECARLRDQLSLNGISNVQLLEIALGEAPSTMALHILGQHTGLATLADVGQNEAEVSSTVSVKVQRGDDLLGDKLPPNSVFKIDVEGFEYHVLRGMSSLLETLRPALLVELEPTWLRRAGTSVEDILAFMHQKGYAALFPNPLRTGLRYRLRLHRIASSDDLVACRSRFHTSRRNAVFVHPESVFQKRLGPLLACCAGMPA